jgi:type II secretory pathway component PulK
VLSQDQRASNNRGVALIIVLLVTALLIALIFEFAYGTRVSLRAAANFRNSQRAYFLARSGFGVFARFPQLRDYIPQGEWGVVPYVSEGDRELKVLWEDESGKIDISRVIATPADPGFNRLVQLFFDRGVNQKVLNDISDWMTANHVSRFYLLSELHQFMSDEEFGKVQDALAVSQLTRINVNTASVDVLKSVFPNNVGIADEIAEKRKTEPFNAATLTAYLNNNPGLSNLSSGLTTSSNVFKVSSFATVGGYTKQIEAIITLSGSGYTPNYWRAL